MQERGKMSLQINMFKFIPEGIYADIKELIKTLNKQIKWGLGANATITVEFNTIEATQKQDLKLQ